LKLKSRTFLVEFVANAIVRAFLEEVNNCFRGVAVFAEAIIMAIYLVQVAVQATFAESEPRNN
jgi:hypothetical protein